MAPRGANFVIGGCLFNAAVIFSLLMHAQSPSSKENEVRHFGPLIVVSFHVAVDDPEQIARRLLEGKPDERQTALQAIGVDSVPAVRELWTSPRQGTDPAPPEQLAKSWISTGVPNLIYTSDPNPYKVIDVGVDDLSEHPFQIESIFKKEASVWYRVATISCLCLSEREGDIEFTPAPKRPKVTELAVRFNTSLGTGSIWSDRVVRFRLKDDLLQPVFDKEGNTWRCPDGVEPGKLCRGEIAELLSTQLIDSSGHHHHGMVLLRGEETTRHLDKEVGLITWLTCTPYLWNEDSFTYKVTEFKANACRGIRANKSQTLNSESAWK
jgi:hypothetical protein